MSEKTGVPSRLLNNLFIEKAAEGKKDIAGISSVFIRDRLTFAGKPKPDVSCDFRREADLLKWRFNIKFADQEMRIVGVEMTEQMLMASDMSVPYLLERTVREELGLNGTKEEPHKTIIIGP